MILLSLPVSATISQVQSTAAWGQSGTTCMATFNAAPQSGDLIVVWTSWTWTVAPGTNITVTGVTDEQLNPYLSAVGPSFRTTNNSTMTGAQIVYARNVIGGGPDKVTVTFNTPTGPTSSNCVAVEYSGADLVNPLDSTTGSYSSSSTGFLEGGNLIPASSNLLVFAGGVADSPNTAMTAGSGFASVQASNGGWGTAMVENASAALSGTNSLPRATACIGSNSGGTSLPCPPGGTAANWLMDVAVFRESPSTVAGGWNPVRPYQVADATQFPGVDPCVQTKTAIEIPISNNQSPVVDSRGFISNGIPCSVAPMAPTDKGTWFPSPGVWEFSFPLIIGGQMDIWGASIGYSANTGTVFQTNNPTINPTWPSTGGYGGVAPTDSTCTQPPAITQWNSSCHYYRGTEATTTNGTTITTWYALQNNVFGNTTEPGSTLGKIAWTNAANFPNPVVEENITGNGNDVESNSIHNLALSAQYSSVGSQSMTDGVVLYLNTNGQEQVIADRIKYRNPTVAGIWLDNGLTADSGPYLGGTIGYDDGPTSGSNLNQLACKVSLPSGGIGSDNTIYSTQSEPINTITVMNGSGYYSAEINLSTPLPAPSQMWVGEVVDIANNQSSTSPFAPYAPGVTDESNANYHGYWMVWSVQDNQDFTILLPNNSSYTNCSSNCGTANFFPLGINVTANGTPTPSGTATTAVTPNRGFYNFTINGTSCTAPPAPPNYVPNYSNYPPLGAQWSTGSMPFHDSHIEGHRVGLCVGCFGPDTQSHFANLNIETNVKTAILISNQYSYTSSGITYPGVTQADFRDIQCGISGGLAVYYCIVDLINGNNLTSAGQSGYIHHYWLDSSGLAHFEGGNCSEMQKGWCRGTTAGGTDTAWNFYSGGTVMSSIDNLITPSTTGGSPAQVFTLTGGQGGSCAQPSCTGGTGQGSAMTMGQGGTVNSLVSGTGGQGGSLTLTTGQGGNGSNLNGGTGGDLILNTGSGGTGATAGNPGMIKIQQGGTNVFTVAGTGAVTISTPVNNQPLMFQQNSNSVFAVNALGAVTISTPINSQPITLSPNGTGLVDVTSGLTLTGTTPTATTISTTSNSPNLTLAPTGTTGVVNVTGELTLTGTAPATTIGTSNAQNLDLTPDTTGTVVVSNVPTGSSPTPTLKIMPNWSSITGPTDAALLVNPNTSGPSGSFLIDAKVGTPGTSEWNVDQAGDVTQAGGLVVSGTGGITASNGAVVAGSPTSTTLPGMMAWGYGTSGTQTCPTNDFCIFGFPSAPATAYGWQPPSAPPTPALSTQFMQITAPSSGSVYPISYLSTVPISEGGTNATSAPSTGGTIPNVINATTSSWTATPTLGVSGTLGSITMGNASGSGGSGTLTLEPTTGALGTGTVQYIPVPPSSPGTLTQTIAAGTAALPSGSGNIISSGGCSAISATTITTSFGTLSNVVSTDNLMADFNADPTGVAGYEPSSGGMLTIIKFPSNSNVNFRVCNNTASAITPGSVTLNWRVVR